MKRTISINIASIAFFIDEDAYEKLQKYQNKLENWFRSRDGGKEVIKDIEARMAELFSQRINPKTGVITSQLVDEVIGIMGQPEDFEDGSQKEGQDSGSASSNANFGSYRRSKQLYRDIDNRVFGGVCSGIATYFNVDTLAIRILFAVLPFLSLGVIIPIYIILWIAIPAAHTTAQKLEMRGENITISNIEKSVKEEYEKVKEQFGNFKNSDTYKAGEDFVNRMKRRDRNVLIIVAAIVALLFLSRYGLMHIGVFPVGVGMSHIMFPGLIPLLIVIVILAFVFPSAKKGFLVLFALVIVASLLMKILGAVFFSPWFFTFLS